jgi:heme exporter protein A
MRLLGRGVRCVRGGRDVFSDLDFEVAAGEALAVTGRNGSGKTSLLRLIAGLLTPADGSIALEGGETELTLAEQAHYLGHRDALKPALSVLENLAFWRDFLGGEISDAGVDVPPSLAQSLAQNLAQNLAQSLARSLASVGLDHATDLPAAFLSAGQRRRLSIARLVAVRRPVWLLDEPTTALDTAGQSLFSTLMHSHLATGGIIIAATHGPLGVEARELRIGGAAIRNDPAVPRLS